MNTHLTKDQIDSYRENGCLVYENFLSDREIDDLLTGIGSSLEEMGTQRVAGDSVLNKNTDDVDDFYENVFIQKINLWKISNAVKSVFLNPELGEMVCRLEGIDGIRVWHDQTLQKKPWANPTAWHLDNPYWSFHSRHAISIWVALDDATVQNGCLFYLPGTHKTAKVEKNVGIGKNFGSLLREYPDWSRIEPISGVMKRGDCGFHNGLVAHGAGVNNTPHPRRAMTCAYMPDGSTFNGQKNILPKAYVDKLSIGDVLDDEEQNPLVWRRS